MMHLVSFCRLDMAPDRSLAVAPGSSLADTKKKLLKKNNVIHKM